MGKLKNEKNAGGDEIKGERYKVDVLGGVMFRVSRCEFILICTFD